MLARYNSLLTRFPVRTKMMTTGVLGAVGDLLAQVIEHRQAAAKRRGRAAGAAGAAGGDDVPLHLEPVRTLRMATFGAFCFAPLTHRWFAFLEKAVKVGGLKGGLLRAAVDQTVYAPFILSTFYGVMGVLEQRPVQETVSKVRENIWPTLVVNWMIWPAVQTVNMSVVPLQHRIALVNVVNIPWMAYLATRASGVAHEADEPVEPLAG